MPPYLPEFENKPRAFVASIHRVGDRVKAFKPASFLNPSNSTGLKLGLCRVSQRSQRAFSPSVSLQGKTNRQGNSTRAARNLKERIRVTHSYPNARMLFLTNINICLTGSIIPVSIVPVPSSIRRHISSKEVPSDGREVPSDGSRTLLA